MPSGPVGLPQARREVPAIVGTLLNGVGADNLCHLGRCSAVRGLASGAGRAGLGRPDAR
jgi:hypothetical protein